MKIKARIVALILTLMIVSIFACGPSAEEQCVDATAAKVTAEQDIERLREQGNNSVDNVFKRATQRLADAKRDINKYCE
ncbi:hypothetical protein FIM04_04330 [SAR202 cluster bacterium AC-409-J13_OGT_754m]|nr:hypothetical protein [SAR202 cluster bacterium AC-409-J13_OGT_754m]